MRIIGGRFKGRRLKAPSDDAVRPTLAIIREAFFDITGAEIRDAAFLDLYAGTGAMGIEALSRGAGMVYFVERSNAAATLLLKNLALIKDTLLHSELYAVIKKDADRALEHMKVNAVKIDIAYIDPPYEDLHAYSDIVPLLINGGLMNKFFTIGIEHRGQMKEVLDSMTYALVKGLYSKTHKYGDKYLTVLRQH